MKKCRILVLIGSRSDEGLSAPVLSRLEKDEFFEVSIQNLYPGDFYNSYILMNNLDLSDIDVVLATGDRLEMYAACIECFNKNIPIAHLYAGIVVDGEPTKDEVYRHCISLMSDIQFCESFNAENNLFLLFNVVKKKKDSYIVGITHFDDLLIDESLVPKGKYNLILYNPIKDILKMEWEINEIRKKTKFGEIQNVIIDSNADNWFDNSKDLYYNLAWNDKTWFYKSLPRPQFFGLIKNCNKFISNSSAIHYEAPCFLKPEQIIPIGIREKERTPVDITKIGASDKIIKYLKKWWKKKNE